MDSDTDLSDTKLPAITLPVADVSIILEDNASVTVTSPIALATTNNIGDRISVATTESTSKAREPSELIDTQGSVNRFEKDLIVMVNVKEAKKKMEGKTSPIWKYCYWIAVEATKNRL
jgi:hypothetical protein